MFHQTAANLACHPGWRPPAGFVRVDDAPGCRYVFAVIWAAIVLVLPLLAAPAARADTVRSGSLRADVGTEPFSLTFAVDGGPVLSSATDAGPLDPSALSVRTAAGWVHATTVSAVDRRGGGGLRMTVETSDPLGGTFAIRVSPAGEGIIEVEAAPMGTASEVLGIGAAWAAPPDERFYGLGERANVAQHRGARVESYVSDGPWIEADRALISAVLPKPGFRARDDATYFPVPWVLSSRGYGVLVDNDETAYHDLATPERPDA
jgi:hypothetical protein